MKSTFALLLLAAGLVISTAGSAKAQSDNTADNNRHSDVRTMSGCLLKGDGANEYRMTGQDGSTWEMRSDAVDLASHVGETVRITGTVNNSGAHNMKEDMKQEAQEHGMDKSATEHGHLTVTELNVMSHHCSR